MSRLVVVLMLFLLTACADMDRAFEHDRIQNQSRNYQPAPESDYGYRCGTNLSTGQFTCGLGSTSSGVQIDMSPGKGFGQPILIP